MASYIERRRNERQVMRLGGFEYELWYEDLPADVADEAGTSIPDYESYEARLADAESWWGNAESVFDTECPNGLRPARLCQLCNPSGRLE